MRALVYLSDEQTPFDEVCLVELASRAAARNAELGVTGYLYYAKGRFLQYLEGEVAVVSELMDRITVDARHDVRTFIHTDDLAERRFPSWGMRWINSGRRMQIELESVLSDHLLFIQSVQANATLDHDWHPRAWSLVDKLAEVQQSVDAIRGK